MKYIHDVITHAKFGDDRLRGSGVAFPIDFAGRPYNTLIHKKFLYRIKKNRRGQKLKQLALPKELKHRVMTLAHAGIMSGHHGVYRLPPISGGPA